jgi:hypothetical protein
VTGPIPGRSVSHDAVASMRLVRRVVRASISAWSGGSAGRWWVAPGRRAVLRWPVPQPGAAGELPLGRRAAQVGAELIAGADDQRLGAG